jgi:WD40 repeat protein/serine/threonine protein kinase
LVEIFLMETRREWRENDVILDLYRVEGVLGEGGMGRVYRVRHTGWNIDLAVKTPLAKHLTEAGKKNFTREAETWVSLSLHPHAVSCYYVREVDRLPRIFAECVEGGSLKDWIDDGRLYDGGAQVALERMLDVAVQFAWGLHHAHKQGLVHQDVKPGNIMMTPEGVAKVTDFGLAQARAASGEVSRESDPTISVVVAGAGAMTPAYCSPEQRAKEPLTRRTDVWSWGASVLEMFAGGLQWVAGPEVEEALDAYLEEWSRGERSEGDGPPEMPGGVVALLRRCFHRSPQERPRDMREVAETLLDIYRRETGRAYPRKEPQAGKSLADSLNNRAVSLLDLGKKSEALGLWEEVLRMHPQHPEATYNHGLISWRDAKTDDAALLRQLGGVKTSNRPAWWGEYLQALVHVERNDVMSAVRILEKIESAGEAQAEVTSLLQQARDRLPDSAGPRFTITEMDVVLFVSYSPGGDQIVSVVSEKLKLWTKGGKYLDTICDGRNIKSICFSPDGKLVAAADDFGIVSSWETEPARLPVWEVETALPLKHYIQMGSLEPARRDALSLNLARPIEVPGHRGAVEAVCFSPDWKYLASGSIDNTIKLWDVKTGKCLRTFTRPRHMLSRTGIVSSVSYSPDGRFVASGSSEGNVELWGTVTGEYLPLLVAHRAGVRSVCFSPDGKLLASCGDDYTVNLWDMESGKCLHTLQAHSSVVPSVSFSRDGKYLASGSWDKTIKLWEVATGKCLHTIEGHTNQVNSVSFSPDRQFVASGSSDKTIKVWKVVLTQVASPFLLSQISASEKITEVEEIFKRHLADARAALKGGELAQAVKHLRDARALPGCERRKEAVALWASLYPRMTHASLKAVWPEDTSRPIFKEEITNPTLSPDGVYIAAISFGTVVLYETETGRRLRDFAGDYSPALAVAFSPDGKLLASGGSDRTVRLWDASTGECLRTIQAHSASVLAVSFSPDGKLVASTSGDRDYSTKVWDVATGSHVRTFPRLPGLQPQSEFISGRGHYISSVSFSPDGRLVATGGSDGVVRLWKLATGLRWRYFGHSRTVDAVSFSPDGTQLASASWDETIILWDVETGKSAGVFGGYSWGHKGGVSDVAFSPDGRYLASGGYDKTVKIWDKSTRECLTTLDGHTSGVKKVSFSPDARYILSCGEARLNDVCSLLWFLDWELDERDAADWDEDVRPRLQNFLILHTPYGAKLPADRELKESELTRALTRKGTPAWGEKDFEELMQKLRSTGYSHLNPEGVRRELEKMVRDWEAAPPQLLHSYTSPLFKLTVTVVLLIILAAIVAAIVFVVLPLLYYLLG